MAGCFLLVRSGSGDPNDGFTNAPAGSAQHSSLLSGYTTIPSWRVAGVNYATGYPSGQSLRDPVPSSLAAGLVALGGSYNSGNHVITFGGTDNIVIDGWDFSLHGGFTVLLVGVANATIQNCKFGVGTNGRQPISIDNACNGVTITKNVIDGNGLDYVPSGQGLIESNAYNTSTITYNWVKNSFYESIVLGASPNGNCTSIIKYNLIDNAGLGFALGAHGDWIQTIIDSNHVFDSFTFSYNTCVQSLNDATARTQGLSIFSAGGQFGATGYCSAEVVSNNTLVVSGTGGNAVNYPIIIDNTWLNGNAFIADNFIDPTGINGSPIFFGDYSGGFGGGRSGTKTGNLGIKMTDGSTLTTVP